VTPHQRFIYLLSWRRAQLQFEKADSLKLKALKHPLKKAESPVSPPFPKPQVIWLRKIWKNVFNNKGASSTGMTRRMPQL
jgi:hypothetical protein